MPLGANRTVLMADDNEDDLFFARRALQKAGVTAAILTCADGSEVIELLTRLRAQKKPAPDAIFLDIKMPNCDGFQTLRWIREQKHLQEVRVVMLSGSHESRDVALARSLGADDYLVKMPTAEAFSKVLSS